MPYFILLIFFTRSIYYIIAVQNDHIDRKLINEVGQMDGNWLHTNISEAVLFYVNTLIIIYLLELRLGLGCTMENINILVYLVITYNYLFHTIEGR